MLHIPIRGVSRQLSNGECTRHMCGWWCGGAGYARKMISFWLIKQPPPRRVRSQGCKRVALVIHVPHVIEANQPVSENARRTNRDRKAPRRRRSWRTTKCACQMAIRVLTSRLKLNLSDVWMTKLRLRMLRKLGCLEEPCG